jgi:hypothetical protein
MTMTTIKVDADLRDRLNAEARRRGETAGSFVEVLFELWLREQRFADVRRAMATTPGADLATYRAEAAELDVLVADGLDGGSQEW